MHLGKSFIFLFHVTELQLCNARHSKPEDATEDDTPSTSGRQIYETEPSASSSKVVRACYLNFYYGYIFSCALPGAQVSVLVASPLHFILVPL
jgi:hypothetical protein